MTKPSDRERNSIADQQHAEPASRLTRTAATLAALGIGAVLAAAPASAHVHVSADEATQGDYATLTFKVPNESDKGSATTEFSVALPNLTSVSTEQMPGWSARLDRDLGAGTVTSITWTAAPGAGIAADEFAMFGASVKLPVADSVSFPATQTYADGEVVRWNEPTPVGGAEPEHPAPTLELNSAAGEPAVHRDAPAPAVVADARAPQPDTTARWLAGSGLVVAVLGVVLAAVRRRT